MLAFPEGILANFLHIVEMIEEFGPKIGMPFTRSIKSGLFEIRAKGKEGIARALYCSRLYPGTDGQGAENAKKQYLQAGKRGFKSLADAFDH